MSSYESNNDLINKALGIARTISYNGPTGPAKQMLHELTRRLGDHTLRIHKKTDGLLLINCFGRSRYLTLRERILYRLFGVVPTIDRRDPQ